MELINLHFLPTDILDLHLKQERSAHAESWRRRAQLYPQRLGLNFNPSSLLTLSRQGNEEAQKENDVTTKFEPTYFRKITQSVKSSATGN